MQLGNNPGLALLCTTTNCSLQAFPLLSFVTFQAACQILAGSCVCQQILTIALLWVDQRRLIDSHKRLIVAERPQHCRTHNSAAAAEESIDFGGIIFCLSQAAKCHSQKGPFSGLPCLNNSPLRYVRAHPPPTVAPAQKGKLIP